MSALIEIVPVKAAHVRAIARSMRRADRDEIEALSDKTPVQALAFSVRKSSLARTAIIDGAPAFMFGVADINVMTGTGAVWLLGTDAVEKHYVAFLRGSVAWRDQLLQRYPVMRNFVDARNRVSIRWLRWLGFTLSEPVFLRGHACHLFELRRSDV